MMPRRLLQLRWYLTLCRIVFGDFTSGYSSFLLNELRPTISPRQEGMVPSEIASMWSGGKPVERLFAGHRYHGTFTLKLHPLLVCIYSIGTNMDFRLTCLFLTSLSICSSLRGIPCCDHRAIKVICPPRHLTLPLFRRTCSPSTSIDV